MGRIYNVELDKSHLKIMGGYLFRDNLKGRMVRIQSWREYIWINGKPAS